MISGSTNQFTTFCHVGLPLNANLVNYIRGIILMGISNNSVEKKQPNGEIVSGETQFLSESCTTSIYETNAYLSFLDLGICSDNRAVANSKILAS